MNSQAELYREYRQRGGVADLSDRIVLSLTGADRVRYLNGQVTINISRLPVGESQPACVLTPKGRLCGDLWIAAHDDALFIDAEPTLQETLPARLERYIIADDATVEEVTGRWKLVHLFGDPPPDAASLPPRRTRSARFRTPGWDFYIAAEAFEDAWQMLLSTRLPALDAALVESIRIERGIPRWGFELDEHTLPPEAGLDQTHIDYHKGCYVGQEVVSRLKSIGHVNRQLAGFIAADREALLTAPMSVMAPDAGKPVGQITSATWSFALERHIALGYVKRGIATTGLSAHGAAGVVVAVTVHSLPFLP
jgi:folate-binding protein YgfZ